MLKQMKYALLTKLRNPSIVFWPFLFPLALATLMYFAIGQMDQADFETVPAAVVVEEEGEAVDSFLPFVDAMDESSGLIRAEKMTEEAALKALEKGEAEGIFYVGNDVRLTVSGNGFPESILQSVLASYQSGEEAVKDIARLHPEGMQDALEKMKEYDTAVNQVSLGGTTIDGNVQIFYALIGMACLYGCFIGFGCALWLQANLTALAARRCVAPVHRLKLILTEFGAGFLVHFANMIVLLAYMRYVLKLEFTGSFAEMTGLVLVGSMFGVSMGIFVGSLGKVGEGIRIGILLGISMSLSFLAGLMDASVKDAVEQHAPVLSRVNPAALISDALYCINVYDAPERFADNMVILIIMSALMVGGAFLIVRRERYGSI
ncbi:MAG TPA: ABC transporter permease [Candidatus Mediterraneibacter norwichensis]|nr:ABC transporter permease [Candidatus Mediterraneibacter norwichensis]